MGDPTMPREVLDLGFVDAHWMRKRAEYISVFHARAYDGTPVVVRCVPSRVASEGHYGYDMRSLTSDLQALAQRLAGIQPELPSGLARWTYCGMEPSGSWFVLVRPWYSTTLAQSRDWVAGLRNVASALDHLKASALEVPVALVNGNLFVDRDGRGVLADHGLDLLGQLIRKTYAGPYTLNLAEIRERLFFDRSSADGLLRQLAAAWTKLRTGHLPPDALALLSEPEQALLHPLLQGDSNVSMPTSCEALIVELTQRLRSFSA